MTYDDYYDGSDDLENFDFAAEKQKRDKKAKEKREKSQSKSLPKAQVGLPDKSALQTPTKIVSNSSQKNLDILVEKVQKRVYAEPSVPINCITVGNVDAGKSTIFGHLIYLLQDETRDFEKLEKLSEQLNKPSFKYAYYLDTNSQERERGVTISVNSYSLTIENKQFIMQDCPGHQDFSDQIQKSVVEPDVGILALEANQFSRLQEKIEEQLRMLVVFNVGRIIVIVNKMDMIGFDQTQFGQIRKDVLKMNKHTQKLFGANIPIEIIPCAAMEDVDNNLVESSQKMLYAESTLKQCLVNCKPKPKEFKKDPIISILDFVSAEGKQFFTCSVLQGSILKDDVFYIQQNLLTFEVDEIFDMNLQKVDTGAGLCRIQISVYQTQVPGLMSSFSIDLFQKVHCGSQATLIAQYLQQHELKMSNRLRVQLFACQELFPGANFDGYVFNQKVDCRIRKIDAILQKDKFMEGIKDFASQNDVVICDLECQEKIVVKEGYRIVLRGQMNIMAVGILKAWK